MLDILGLVLIMVTGWFLIESNRNPLLHPLEKVALFLICPLVIAIGYGIINHC